MSKKDKQNYLAVGIVLIIIGIGLTLFSILNPIERGSMFFYGLIIFTLGILFRDKE